MNNQFYAKGVLLLVSLFSIHGCAEEGEVVREYSEIARTGGIVVNSEADQPQSIWGNLSVVDEAGMAFGIDFRKRLPYKLSLETGRFYHLSSPGAGPQELRMPSQISVKNDSIYYVYDTALDAIARFKNDQITEKLPGYLEHNVWVRNPKGFVSGNTLITSIKEPEYVNALDFEYAKPIGLFYLGDNNVKKVGSFSPTVDDLDENNKYPFVTYSKKHQAVYYVFYNDYSIMKYDLENDISMVGSDYKPTMMRDRTIPIDPNNPNVYQMARVYGLDMSQVAEIEILGDQLIVCWYNATGTYYDQNSFTPEGLDFFGVVYDLPDLTNPREFTLPGKLLGIWGDRLLIEENDDVMEYTIGFYEFQ
jgi:hypothetical protein